MNTLPTISVVIETLNATPESKIELQDVLDGLAEQAYPKEKLESIVVVDEANSELAAFVRGKYPETETVLTTDPSYYGMKICGIKAAEGDIVALLDSDCLPGENWASEIVATMSAGADIVAGKVRFPSGARFSRTFELFDYGHIRNGQDGEAEWFNVSNCAIRKDVIQKHPFDHRLRRSGGGTLLGCQLKSLGYKIVYNPRMRVVHNDPGLRTHILTRFRTGYEAVNLCRLDDAGILPDSKFLKLGALAPFALSLRRMLFDFGTVLTNRRDLDIPRYQIPYFLGASAIVRGAESIMGLLTVMSPSYLAKRFGW